MAKRRVVFADDQLYHIFNRSIAGENIFTGKREFGRALDLLDYYRYPQKIRFSQFKLLNKELRQEYLERVKKRPAVVEIFAFAFMPDHYHFLVKQKKEKGITRFIANIQNAFAKYFNIKRKRFGSVFQNPFKAKYIESDEQLVHISRYIHLNPVTSFIIEFEDLKNSPLTSFHYYLDGKKEGAVKTDFLLKRFGSSKEYEKFVFNQIDYQRKLHLIRKCLLD